MSSRTKFSRRHQFRVIGGTWRGRRLAFAPHTTVRPTGDRIRETLFNWLQPHIEDARCLDLFAGSGALGFEALSRGAKEVVLVESEHRLAESIEANLALLDCHAGLVFCQTAESWLEQEQEPFDIVYLDPPFAAQLLGKLCKLMGQHNLIRDGGFCYLEMDIRNDPPDLPAHWQVLRDKTAGQVRYQLVQIQHGAPESQ